MVVKAQDTEIAAIHVGDEVFVRPPIQHPLSGEHLLAKVIRVHAEPGEVDLAAWYMPSDDTMRRAQLLAGPAKPTPAQAMRATPHVAWLAHFKHADVETDEPGWHYRYECLDHGAG